MVSFIIIGGPHTIATQFLEAGASSFSAVGTKPIFPFQSGGLSARVHRYGQAEILALRPVPELSLVNEVGGRARP